MIEREKAPIEEEEKGPIGIFPSWRAVYGAVLLHTFLLILVLYWLTVTLDYHG